MIDLSGPAASRTVVRWLPAWLRGLKGRLAIVVALVLVVPTAFAVVQAMRVLRDDEQRQLGVLERTLALITGYHDQVAAQATLMVKNLATRDVVRGSDIAACDDAMATQAEQGSLFRSFSRADATGRVICSSSPTAHGLTYGDRPWFRSLAAGQGGVVSSGVMIGRNPGVGRTIIMATSIAGENGRFLGTVSVALALDELIALPLSIQLPTDTIAAVVDLDGNIATSRGDLNEVSLDQDTLRAMATRPGKPVAASGSRGRTWQFMARHSGLGGIRTAVVVGLPKESWGWFDARFQVGILLPTSILFLSVLVVWVATDLLITRPLLKLAKAVRKWRRDGEMPVLALDDAPEELGELAHAFTRAAGAIVERDRLLQASLQEKDLLLREIHHRVKNNLQIVTSLLNLRSNSLRNEQAQRAMFEAQLGIKALALVHRKLYERLDLKQVSLDELLDELCPLVHELSSDLSPQVRLSVVLEHVVVLADQATPLALLCTELLSNAAKHAFPEDRPGTIEVRLERLADGRAELSVADNGIGMDAGLAAKSSEEASAGLGTRLIQMFARQLHGELTVSSPAIGTCTSLIFQPAPT